VLVSVLVRENITAIKGTASVAETVAGAAVATGF